VTVTGGGATMSVGIGSTSPFIGTTLSLYNTTSNWVNAPDNNPGGHIWLTNSKSGSSRYAMEIGMDQAHGFGYFNAAGNNNHQPICFNVRGGGNVGIGTTNPAYRLSVQGHSQVINTTTNDVMGLFSPDYGSYILIGAWNAQGSVSKNIVMQQYGGNVGIGITNPSVPLHVINYANVNQTVSGARVEWYCTGYNAYAFTANSSQNVSIRSQASMLIEGGAYIAWSDSRIKKDIQPIENALEKISQLRIVSYKHIDKETRDVDGGVIAQEVKELFPNAVSVTDGYIPNIYNRGNHTNDNEIVTIYVSCSHPDIKIGSKVKMIIIRNVVDSNYKDAVEEEYITEIVNYSEDYLMVKSWKDYSSSDRVFVYGCFINDLMSVDKDQLSMISIGALQEINKKVEHQEEIIKEQHQIIASTQSQLASLLAWAQAQGYSAS